MSVGCKLCLLAVVLVFGLLVGAVCLFWPTQACQSLELMMGGVLYFDDLHQVRMMVKG